MIDAPADPRCPEFGGPIGATAACGMHCPADPTGVRASADGDEDSP